eukprot:gene11712-11857_t
MMLVVCDPLAARRVNLRLTNRQMGAQLRLEEGDQVFDSQGLVAARDEQWHTLRGAWQPAFQSGSLEGYSEVMDDCAAQLARRLEEVGQSGQVVDLAQELKKMTLQVVGSTAFGVDFQTLPEEPCHSTNTPGQKLLTACQTILNSGGMSATSIYVILNALFPGSWLVGLLASTWPDQPLRELKQARRTIRQVSMDLINQWRVDHQAGITQPAATASCSGEVARSSLLPSLSDGQPEETGVTSASLTHNRKKKKEVPWTDMQVVAQSNEFILAGFETTANTLAFCVYNIAAHPLVQRRLLQEIDALGRHRKITHPDLALFPYTEAVVRETLRLFPPATILNRGTALANFEVAPGVVVDPGTLVATFLYGYQRDPEYWPCADSFMPERWLLGETQLAPSTPEAWTPFGSGSRMCVGWRFALQEAKIALIRLYQHQTYELVPHQVPLATEHTLMLAPKHGVRVQVLSRRD